MISNGLNNGTAVKESQYKTAVVAKGGKKILAYLLDFFLNLAMTLLLFALIDMIANSIPAYASIKNDTASAQTALYQIVYDSKLSSATSSSYFMTEEELRNEYLYGIIITSYPDETLKDTEPYKNYSAMGKENDRLFYYYTTYKSEHSASYSDSKALSYDEYLETIYPNSKDYFQSDDGYPVLKEDIASNLREYILGSYEPGKEIYDNLTTDRSSAVISALNKDLPSSLEYQEKYLAFNNGKDKILTARASFLLIGYIMSSAISFIMFPFIFKDGKTLAFKAMSLAYTDLEGNSPKWFQNIFHFAIMTIEESGMIILAVFLLFGSEGMYLLSLNIWGFINILYLTIFSALLMLASCLFVVFNKKTRQSLSEISSLLIAKNTKEYIIEEKGKENKKELTDGNN